MRDIVVSFRLEPPEAAALDAAVAKARRIDRNAGRSSVLRELVRGLAHQEGLLGRIVDLEHQLRIVSRQRASKEVKQAPPAIESGLVRFRADVEDYVASGVTAPCGNYALDRFWNKHGRSWSQVLVQLQELEACQ